MRRKERQLRKASGPTQEIKTLEITSKNTTCVKTGMLFLDALGNFKTDPGSTHSVLHS